MAITKTTWLRLYRDIIRDRVLDIQMVKNAQSGKMPPGWHSGQGEDALVATVGLLKRDDYACYTHRGAYNWIGKGISMKEIIAEFYAKATGCAGGYGGTHISKPSLGIFGRCGMQGGHYPQACGMGIAAQLRGKGQVVMEFAGDGASTRGTIHEAFNHASIWKLPVIFILENNGQSMNVTIDKTWANPRIAEMAAFYRIPSKTIDGNDVVAVAEASQEAIDRGRKGEGPTMLELVTFRWRGHYEGDALKYYTKEQLAEWVKKDPVPRYEKWLMDKGYITKAEIAKIQKDAEEECAEAQKFALESPDPDPSKMMSKIYATSHS
jgi:TPP-dependent pyruvate/acetoin dehydrogenase alpha subunit